MISVGRILCPIDFSECADRAVRHATRIARWYEAEIHGLHVVPLMTEGWAVPLAVATSAAAPPMPAGMRESLDRRLAPARTADLPVETYLREGGAAHEILAHAREANVDLIVMGSHGRGGFQHLLLGSVTESVVRKAPCPVMTVCHAGEPSDEPGPPFRRIVCAVDFEPASEQAVRFALSLAEDADAEITLVHVVEPFLEEETARHAHISVEDYRQFLERQLVARLGALIPTEATNACRPREVVCIGRPWEEITRVAKERAADLLVMGLHGGRGAVDRLVFGSTTQHALRHAECPVLTVGDPRLAAPSRRTFATARASRKR
jgi:nucleotide-binding universal stress UspA family protein